MRKSSSGVSVTVAPTAGNHMPTSKRLGSLVRRRCFKALLPVSRRATLTAALLLSASMSLPASAQDQRILLPGELNGKPATLVLDTGTSFFATILEDKLAKFGLDVADRSSDKPDILRGFTKPVTIKHQPNFVAENVRLAVLSKGPVEMAWEFDAIIGWAQMRQGSLRFSKQAAVTELGSPRPGRGAASFPIIADNIAAFDADSGPGTVRVHIDTGWSGGVQLASELWRNWRAKNQRPFTLMSSFSPQYGLTVAEQMFASELEIEGLKLRNVIVSELPRSVLARAHEPQVVLGLDAFTNHELFIDGPGNKVLIGRPEARLLKPSYNRLGATFAPGTMAAKVAPGSPAANAGLREGDVLELIDGMAPPQYAALHPGRNVWEQPAGTKVTLTLRRDGRQVTKQVMLWDFLEP